MTKLDKLLEMIVTDPEFREKLISEPESTLLEIGIKPSKEILTTLKELGDDEIESFLSGYIHDERAAR